MSNPTELELHKQFTNSNDKFIYFILATTASAIGFAITQTKNEALNIFHIPLGIALLLWLSSFYFGLKNIEALNTLTKMNLKYIQICDTINFSAPTKKDLEFKKKMEYDLSNGIDSQRSKLYSNLHKNLFFVGIISYICWHFGKMLLLNMKSL
jgi:hypothetical protein